MPAVFVLLLEDELVVSADESPVAVTNTVWPSEAELDVVEVDEDDDDVDDVSLAYGTSYSSMPVL